MLPKFAFIGFGQKFLWPQPVTWCTTSSIYYMKIVSSLHVKFEFFDGKEKLKFPKACKTLRNCFHIEVCGGFFFDVLPINNAVWRLQIEYQIVIRVRDK
jgi:hypothetical protein